MQVHRVFLLLFSSGKLDTSFSKLSILVIRVKMGLHCYKRFERDCFVTCGIISLLDQYRGHYQQLQHQQVLIAFNSLRLSDAYMRQLTNHHCFREWLVAWSAPSHSVNQLWNIDNSNLKNKLQWNPKQNSYIFIQENAFENVVCEMAAILSRPQFVKGKNILWYHFLLSIQI